MLNVENVFKVVANVLSVSES